MFGRIIMIDFCVLGGVSTTSVGDLIPAYGPYSIQVDLSWVVPCVIRDPYPSQRAREPPSKISHTQCCRQKKM